jgi:hypothetical protein
MKANAKTQSDQGLKFDGAEVMSQNRSNKFRGNQWSGHSNDGRLVQMGQQPNRKGNDGACHHSGYADSGRKPMTAALAAVPPQGSVRDNINRGPQVRNPGGTRAFAPSATQNYKGNPDMINAGRGPRKGNQQ